MRRQWWLGVTGMGVCLLSCRNPTQITLVVESDVPGACAARDEIAVTVARQQNVEKLPATIIWGGCDDTEAGANYGTLVITPKEERNEEITIRVTTGVGHSVEECRAPEYDNCIVARRRLGFVPYTELTLPIVLRKSCENNPCPSDETCVVDECRPAKVADSSVCQGSGCDDSVIFGSNQGGAGSGGSNSFDPVLSAAKVCEDIVGLSCRSGQGRAECEQEFLNEYCAGSNDGCREQVAALFTCTEANPLVCSGESDDLLPSSVCQDVFDALLSCRSTSIEGDLCFGGASDTDCSYSCCNQTAVASTTGELVCASGADCTNTKYAASCTITAGSVSCSCQTPATGKVFGLQACSELTKQRVYDECFVP